MAVSRRLRRKARNGAGSAPAVPGAGGLPEREKRAALLGELSERVGRWDLWASRRLFPIASDLLRVHGMTLSTSLKTLASALDLRPYLGDVDDDDPALVPFLLYMGCVQSCTADLAEAVKTQMRRGDAARWAVLRAMLFMGMGMELSEMGMELSEDDPCRVAGPLVP